VNHVHIVFTIQRLLSQTYVHFVHILLRSCRFNSLVSHFLFGFYSYDQVLLLIVTISAHREYHMRSISFTDLNIAILFSEKARLKLLLVAASVVSFNILFTLLFHSQGLSFQQPFEG
jgi:hypothetical protein